MPHSQTKIYYLLDTISNPNAGTESQFLKLFDGLKNRKQGVSLAVLRDSDYLQKQNQLKYQNLNIQKIFSLKAIFKMLKFAKELKKNNVQLVHIFFNDSSVIAPIILKLMGIKVIISRRDMGFWYTRLNKLILRLNHYVVDRAVANSRAVKIITEQVEGYHSDKVDVIYNGYDLAQSKNTPSDMPEGTILGIVANIRPIKRMQDAVAALGQLHKSHPHLQLVIVGDGDPKTLKQQAKELGIEQHLHCLGSKQQAIDYIEQFDIALLCSESEGFSNAIIEYLGAGKPVVCSRVGGNPEIIEHGHNGFLYDAGNIEQLSQNLDKILNTPELAKQVSQNAKSSVETRFGEALMLDNYQSLYAAIVAGKK